MYIKQSVGLGGINNKNDVFFVQECLNYISLIDGRIPTLVIDGKMGKNSKKAIYKFQQHIVKLQAPDSRIDPNGRSEKTLVAKLIELDLEFIPSLLVKYKIKKEKQSITGSGPRTIHYRTNAKKVLSSYTENIIKLAMGYAGINKCDISSTLRTFDDQTRIMYNNCKSFPNANSVSALRAARKWGYGPNGREIEELYYKNKSQGEEATKKAMKDRIVELYKQGKMVSLHCVAEGDYKKRNVLDIPYSSVPVNKRPDFEKALMSMSIKIKNIRLPKPAAGETYINRLIIENRCWHIEINQTNKPLPNQKPPAAPIRKKQAGAASIKVTRNYLFDFLDEWF